jgi:cell division septum initiation protein DivIVA
MSEKKPALRNRSPRDRIKPMPAAPPQTLEQLAAENAKLRARNEDLEERNARLTKAVKVPEQAAQETADASKFAATIGTESREDELTRLRALNAHFERELDERRAMDGVNRTHAQAFELIKQLATHRNRFESIELRAAPELLRNRAVPYEATLVVTYSAGTHRFTAVAGDPARALLEALAQFADQLKARKVPDVQDLGALFALIDNQWQIKAGGFSTHAFALAR